MSEPRGGCLQRRRNVRRADKDYHNLHPSSDSSSRWRRWHRAQLSQISFQHCLRPRMGLGAAWLGKVRWRLSRLALGPCKHSSPGECHPTVALLQAMVSNTQTRAAASPASFTWATRDHLCYFQHGNFINSYCFQQVLAIPENQMNIIIYFCKGKFPF